MPSDYGHEQTDKLLKELENRIDKEYSQAAKEVQEKFYAHMKDFERKDAKMQEKLDAGKITETEYQNWRTNQMLTGQRMNALYESLAKDLVNADQIAAGMINDSLPDVYALNMNYSTYKIEHTTEIDTNFTLYDRKTVENLMKDNPRIIPHLTEKQAARIKKDELWNRQHLVSAVAQGILQGEGIPDIAKRLQTVAAMDDNAATRNARTYVTAAQNKGRIDSYERAEKLGIKTNKKWIATLDDRTRVEHRHLDGVSIPYSDVFKMDGYEIEYPGDPSAEPEMIYNCFTGDTSAYTNCDVIRSYAHQYDGDLIEIKTASGVNFTCTPNHPILTLNGWVSAASLHNGDDLLVTRIGNKFGFGRYCNIQHVFSSMKAFHDSLKRNGTIERNAALRVNFHGDVPTSEVEIVTQKRFLSDNGDPGFCESVKKFLLKFSDKTLFCKCTFMEHFRSVWLSTLSDIRSRSKLLSFFKRHLGHSEVHRLRPIALFDARGVKPLQNDVSGNIERISDCLNGFSGIVFADNIVNVNISSRCTHVYNLQTENGYYFVNSIISPKNKRYNGIVAISHNCRCTLVDDILDWPYNDERNDEKLGDMTYEQWKHAKDKPGKDGSTKQDAEIRAEKEKVSVDFGNVSEVIGESRKVASEEYAERMGAEDVDKFNAILRKAEYVENDSGSYYDPETNKIFISNNPDDFMKGTTVFHESTHWFDFNQDYTITEDYGRFHWIIDENGDATGEKEWIPDITTIKEHAGFSEYIAWQWDKDIFDHEKHEWIDSGKKLDMRNFVAKVGTSDTYGPERKPEDVEKDFRAIRNYLEEKGISTSDPDFEHLSDFISAISYDSNLGSLVTGGHSYSYWTKGHSNRVTEITAGYNLLKSTGREDLIEIERDLAPNLMKLIESEWAKIW